MMAGRGPWALIAVGLIGCSSATTSKPDLAGTGGEDASGGDASGGGSGSADASGTDAGGACAPASRCVDDLSVQTCGSDGQWSSAWPCASGSCDGDACAGATTAGPSCAASTTLCGATSESCCTSLEVPGGTFYRTYTNDGDGGTGEADPAWVSGLRLDKYLVTVGRFRQFVAASVAGWTPAVGSGKHVHLNSGQGLANSGGSGYEPGWDDSDTPWLATTEAVWMSNLNCEPTYQSWTDTPGSNETLPMNCISWYEAYAFCIWDGGFLPSEAEWEYAAAGGSEQREYPWGSTDAGTGYLYAISGCDYPAGSTGCTGVMNLAPVGTAALGAGRWGQLDMAGGLSEWTLDWLAPYVTPCTDCVFLTDYSYRTAHGGSFGADTTDIFPWARDDGDLPTDRDAFYGARCARSP
jgi:sulfatase modifying factor 1